MGLLATLAAAAATVWLAVFTLPDSNLHVVFCDVGQGDAILISYQTTQMLIDGGPNAKVLDCLAKHLPFYDRRLEAVVLTHPQADHQTGLIAVVERYTVLQFVRSDVENSTQGFKELIELIEQNKQIGQSQVTTGDVLKISNLKFQIVWPVREFASSELNDHSLVGKLSYQDVDILLTGDADSRVGLAQLATGLLTEVEILKVPHHGSKTAMLDSWLQVVSPQLAVISVGKNNRYGHPRPEPLQQLEAVGAKVLRTDIDGEVEVVSDGEKFWIK